MKIQPKTSLGKLLLVLVSVVVVLIPMIAIFSFDIASFDLITNLIIVIVSLLTFIVIPLSVFKIGYEFKGDKFDKKVELFWSVVGKVQNVLMVIVLVTMTYLFLKTKYGI